MKKYLPLLKTPEATSVMIHLVLFLLLAMIAIKPQEAVQWHSFEWQPIIEEDHAKGTFMVQQKSDDRPRSETVQEHQTRQTNQQPILRSDTPPMQKPTESDLIDPIHHPEPLQTKPDIPPMRMGLRHLHGQAQDEGQSGGDGEYGVIIDTDDIEIVLRVMPDVEVREFGSVTLNFRLRSNGTADPFSIVVLGFDRGLYGSASEEALKKWRFRFKGRYNPSKVYQISFKFIPQ